MAKALKGRSEAETDAALTRARQAMGDGFKNAGLSAADAAELIIRGTLERRWCVRRCFDSRSFGCAARSASFPPPPLSAH